VTHEGHENPAPACLQAEAGGGLKVAGAGRAAHAVVEEVLEVEHAKPPVSWPLLYVLVGLMVMMWTANYIVGKIALREFGLWTLGGLRIEVAAAIMLALFLARRSAAGLAALRQNWKVLGLLSLFGVVLNQVLFVAGLKYTSVAHASLIISLGPVFVLILARLHGLEQLSALKIAGMAISLAGLALLAGERHNGSGPSLLGDFFTVAGSLAFAYYVILGKEVTPRFDSLSLNTFVYLLGAVVALPVTIGGLASGGLAQVTWKGWLAMGYMTVFCSVIAYLIFYFALHYVSATRLATLSYLQPPLATLLGLLFFKEQITLRLITGAVIIFAGVYVTERG
jgi:drug/metabolite transporter (DMT)-like permease